MANLLHQADFEPVLTGLKGYAYFMALIELMLMNNHSFYLKRGVYTGNRNQNAGAYRGRIDTEK